MLYDCNSWDICLIYSIYKSISCKCAIKHNIKFAKALDKENDETLSKEGGEGFLGAIGFITL